MKKCSNCKLEKDESEYHKDSSRKDKLCNKCKVCNNSLTLTSYHATTRKSDVIARAKAFRQRLKNRLDEYKFLSGCCNCDECEPVCLDFHHVNPDDKVSEIGNVLFQKSIRLLAIEIRKCILLCSNCHRKFHAGKIDCQNKPLCEVDEKFFDVVRTVKVSMVLSSEQESGATL